MEHPNTDEHWLEFMQNSYFPPPNPDHDQLVKDMEPWIEEMEIENMNNILKQFIVAMTEDANASTTVQELSIVRNTIANQIRDINKLRPLRFTTRALLNKLIDLYNNINNKITNLLSQITPPRRSSSSSSSRSPDYSPAIGLYVTPMVEDVERLGRWYGEREGDAMMDRFVRFEPASHAGMNPFQKPVLSPRTQQQTSVYGLVHEDEEEFVQRNQEIRTLRNLLRENNTERARHFLIKIAQRYGRDYALQIEREAKGIN